MNVQPPTPVAELIDSLPEDIPMGITYEEASDLLSAIRLMGSALEYLSKQDSFSSNHIAKRINPNRHVPVRKGEVATNLKDLLQTFVLIIQKGTLFPKQSEKEGEKSTSSKEVSTQQTAKAQPAKTNLLSQIKQTLREISVMNTLPKEKLLVEETRQFFEGTKAFLASNEAKQEFSSKQLDTLTKELVSLQKDMKKGISDIFNRSGNTEKSPASILQSITVKAEQWLEKLDATSKENAKTSIDKSSGKKTTPNQNNTHSNKPSSSILSLNREIAKELQMAFLGKSAESSQKENIQQAPFSPLINTSSKPISSYVIAPYSPQKEIENRKKSKKKEKERRKDSTFEEDENEEENLSY